MSTLREHIRDSINTDRICEHEDKLWLEAARAQCVAPAPTEYTFTYTIPDSDEPESDEAVAEMIKEADEEFKSRMDRLLPAMKTQAIKKHNKRKKQKRARCK